MLLYTVTQTQLDATFAGLIGLLVLLFIGTFNYHVLALIVIASSLYGTVKWYIVSIYFRVHAEIQKQK
jgi:hypothetical protein